MFRASSGNYFLLMDYGGNINLGKPHLSLILNLPTSFCGSITKTQIIVLEKRIIEHIQIMFFPVRFVPSQMDIYMWMLPMARSRIWITSSNMYSCLPKSCSSYINNICQSIIRYICFCWSVLISTKGALRRPMINIPSIQSKHPQAI